LSKFDKMARNKVDGEELARSLAVSIVRRFTGDQDIDAVAGGPSLSQVEVNLLSREELDNFCDQFVARRLRIAADAQASEIKGGRRPGPAETGCDGLGHAIMAHTDSQRAQMERILGSSRDSIFGHAAAKAMYKSSQENSIGDQPRKVPLRDMLAEQMHKLRIGGAAEQLHVLRQSASEAAYRTVKASDYLGETIAALRASDLPTKYSATPVEPQMSSFEPPTIPQNSIPETNNLLRKQQAYAEEMRPTLIRSAELIQTLTDTTLATQALANANSAQAERHAQRSMNVAISSVIIAIITGASSIYYASASPTAVQADQLAKELRAQLGIVIASAQADRIALEKKVAEDRAALTAVIAQQSGLIKTKKVTNDKPVRSKSGASK
jgi:hypothetical protein